MSDEKRFTLRMNADIFESVKELAEKNKRSIAKEIEYLVERQLEEQKSSKQNPQ